MHKYHINFTLSSESEHSYEEVYQEIHTRKVGIRYLVKNTSILEIAESNSIIFSSTHPNPEDVLDEFEYLLGSLNYSLTDHELAGQRTFTSFKPSNTSIDPSLIEIPEGFLEVKFDADGKTPKSARLCRENH